MIRDGRATRTFARLNRSTATFLQIETVSSMPKRDESSDKQADNIEKESRRGSSFPLSLSLSLQTMEKKRDHELLSILKNGSI